MMGLPRERAVMSDVMSVVSLARVISVGVLCLTTQSSSAAPRATPAPTPPPSWHSVSSWLRGEDTQYLDQEYHNDNCDIKRHNYKS